MLQGKPTARKL